MKKFVLLLEELILRANSFCQELTPYEKGGKNETGRVAFPEIYLSDEKQIAKLSLLIVE